ncbi:MAG: hypothetical protein AAGG07_14605 [Planctomycetota bacterium]
MHAHVASTSPTHPLLAAIAVLAILAASLTLGGCTVGGQARAVGVATGNDLTARFPVAVYRELDDSGADVYLTDLTREQLDPALPLESIRGHVVHLRMFVRPKPGRTAISDDGTNATMRWAVFAGNGGSLESGLYEGAGFLLPGFVIGGGALTGEVKGASLNLSARTPRFRDRIGPITASVEFLAVEDPAAVRAIESRLRAALLSTRPINAINE